MATELEDLVILRLAEGIADGVWKEVTQWEPFARDVLGGQLARAVDSIGANIAESYGRYHYGEKLQSLYYARGSLFETKYWVNRASKRHIVPQTTAQSYAKRLAELAHALNTFAKSIKQQKTQSRPVPTQIRETPEQYATSSSDSTESLVMFLVDVSLPLFTQDELIFISALPDES